MIKDYSDEQLKIKYDLAKKRTGELSAQYRTSLNEEIALLVELDERGLINTHKELEFEEDYEEDDE